MSLDWMAIFTLNEHLMAFLCIDSLEAVVRPLGVAAIISQEPFR